MAGMVVVKTRSACEVTKSNSSVEEKVRGSVDEGVIVTAPGMDDGVTLNGGREVSEVVTSAPGIERGMAPDEAVVREITGEGVESERRGREETRTGPMLSTRDGVKTSLLVRLSSGKIPVVTSKVTSTLGAIVGEGEEREREEGRGGVEGRGEGEGVKKRVLSGRLLSSLVRNGLSRMVLVLDDDIIWLEGWTVSAGGVAGGIMTMVTSRLEVGGVVGMVVGVVVSRVVGAGKGSIVDSTNGNISISVLVEVGRGVV